MPQFDFEYRTQDKDLLAACAEVLGQLPDAQVTVKPTKGKRLATWDTKLTLTHGGKGRHHADYIVDLQEQVTTTALPHRVERLKMQAERERAKPCFLARYINSNVAVQLRNAGIAYADTAGNLFFHTPFFYALREGAKALPRVEVETRVFHTPAGLRLLGLLLVKPEAVNWQYRALAEAAGIAVGTVHDLLGQLRKEGFLHIADSDHRTLRQPETLLERWIMGYRQRLRPKLLRRRYRAGQIEELPNLLTKANQNVLLGGELAAARITGLLHAQRAALHVPADVDLSELAKRLRLLSDTQGNVDVLVLPGPAAHWMQPGSENPPLVSPILIYAELLATDDDRLREVAAALYDKEISPHVCTA
ncbi:MAG: type IV toxin-antitoxin system AbiEi family antitoxin [Phycisphaerales bacterium]|nr:type IV toxin-antitoxin system AbiEi family antitoxin [Phycisphaerales bacterium]